MEDQNEVLVKITLDEQATEQRIKAIGQQLAFFKDAVKGLDKDLKDGVVSQNQYDEALGRIEKQTANLTKELTYQKKALDDHKKGIVAGSGSLNELRQKAQDAAAQYSALSKAERENSSVGADLLKRVHDLNREYEQQNEKLTTTRKTVVDFVRDLEPFGVNLGQTFDAFKSSGQSIGTFVKGLGSIKNAIAATGIGLLLLALGALYTYLTKSQAGMDFLARKTAGLSAVLQKLTSIAITVGEKIFNAFENPKAAIKELADFVETNLSNRFRSFGVILDAIIKRDWKGAVDGVIQLGTGITGATGKAERFATEMNKVRVTAEAIAKESQRIRDEEIRLNVERAKSLAKIEQLKKLSDDQTKSTQEREAAAKQAYALENDLLQKSIDLQKRKIANVKASNAAQKQDGVETRQAVAEEQIKLSELIEQSATRTTEIQNNLNSIRKEGADLVLSNQKKAANEEINYWERALIMAKRKQQDTLEIESEIVRLRAKLDSMDNSSTDKKGAEEKLLIAAKAEADILELRIAKAIETAARLNSIKEAEIRTLLAQVKEGTLAELELNKAMILTEQDQQKEQARATIKNKEELESKLRQIDAESKKKLLDADKAYLVKQVAMAQQRAEIQQKVADDLMARFNRDQDGQIDKHTRTTAHLLAISEEGTKERFQAELRDLAERRAAAIKAAKGDKEAIKEINKEFDLQEDKIREKRQKTVIDRVVGYVSEALGIVSTLVQAETQRLYDALEEQQAFALKSAGTNADLRAKIEEKFAQKKLEIEKQQAEKQRKIASVANIISTAQAVTEGLKLFATNPILGAITEALIVAKAFAQQQIIDTAKFADGGVAEYFANYFSDRKGQYISNGPGNGRSDSINAKISVGESIINAEATKKHYHLLSAINESTGGRKFPGATDQMIPQPYTFSYGGVAAIANDNVQLMRNVVNEINRVQPVLVVDDVNSKNIDRSRIVKRVRIN